MRQSAVSSASAAPAADPSDPSDLLGPREDPGEEEGDGGDALSPNERPTIPAVPPARDSGVRLTITRVPFAFATVDVVVCNLTRDPRSEDYAPRPTVARTSGASQNERPPSTSIVRALK